MEIELSMVTSARGDDRILPRIDDERASFIGTIATCHFLTLKIICLQGGDTNNTIIKILYYTIKTIPGGAIYLD